MLDLPVPVLDYIHTLTVENLFPAYLLVEKDGRLFSWGGNLATYGVTNLQKGEYVGEQVVFLEGLLPLDGSPMFLPCIKTKDGLAADVHLFSGDEGDWVLLLDATLDESQRRLIQQKSNDLRLLQKKQSRILNQYLENDVTENLAQRSLTLQVRGERKNVTILFANVCGFTSKSENNPPDVVFRTLNLYILTMSQSILDEAGMVVNILGDAVMACFGVLPSTGSPPTQAIKAALGIIEAVRDVGTRLPDHSSALDIGIGIASGPLALGMIGTKDRRTFSAIGYHVKLAARLESQARPSEILIDENTFNEIDSMQKYFSATNLLRKGMLEPLRTYSYLMK